MQNVRVCESQVWDFDLPEVELGGIVCQAVTGADGVVVQQSVVFEVEAVMLAVRSVGEW